MEEEVKMSSNEQGGDLSKDAVSDTDNTPALKGKEKSQGSRRLKGGDPDKVSEISNGVSNVPKKGRGRPKTKTVEDKSGEGHDQTDQDNASNNEENTQEKPLSTSGEDVANGSSGPKAGRGRPKGTSKRKSKSLTQDGDGAPSQPIKRGRPKGSPNKTPRLVAELGTDIKVKTDGSTNLTSSRGRIRKIRVPYSGAPQISKKSPRGRGRPRKIVEDEDDDDDDEDDDDDDDDEDDDSYQTVKRARGRPKGSKKSSKSQDRVTAKKKRSQSKQMTVKRGRPRKHPLPTPEELKKPKVWKPLGRPRKYPRVDPPEGASSPVRRGRGRPRRAESKKGAHLHTHSSKGPVSLRSPADGAPKKRGRPQLSAKNPDVTSRKRGHPKSLPSKEHKAGGSSANEGEQEMQINNSKPSEDADTVEKQDTDIQA